MKRFLSSASKQLLGALLLGLVAGRLPAATFNIADGDVAGFIAAINTANTNNQGDAINLATNGTYNFTAADNQTNGGNALPVILHEQLNPFDVTIHGNGATIQRGANAPVFRFLQINGRVTIDNLTFQGGNSSELGGAIRLAATSLISNVTLTNCTFTTNQATTGGGAIVNVQNAPLTLTNCVFTRNVSSQAGGGLLNQAGGTVTITGCNFNNNAALGFAGGGGVANSAAGTVNVTNTTFDHNGAGLIPGGLTSTAGSGGGIANNATGTVSLTGCILTSNLAATGAGAANFSGTFTVAGCTFSNNTASAQSTGAATASGGAIYHGGGTMTVVNSTISGNTAAGLFNFNSSGSGFGGGITQAAPLTITGSTVSGNTARGGDESNGPGSPAFGGGIYSSAALTAANCTIAGNTVQGGAGFGSAGAQGLGGGVYLSSNTTSSIASTTITLNTAAGGSGTPTAAGLGGGIYNRSTLNVINILVANNTAQSPDADGTFVSQGYNLIGKNNGSAGFTSATDLVGTSSKPLDPKLDPDGLKDNGGPTSTIALLFGSPAIDKGTSSSPFGTLTTDQRGLARTFDDTHVANASGGDGTDIGAYEVQTAAPTATPTPTATATATPTPVATATATPTATATATPTATPIAATLANVSTRMDVQLGDNALIGGFIITGTQPKKVLISALGPSLAQFFTGTLANPVLELYSGNTLLESNDNWVDSPNKQAISDSTLAPQNNLESAIIRTLPANSSQYTAIVRGVSNGTGIGVVQVFDLDRSVDSKLANISTRGIVETGNNVMIGGFIVSGATQQRVIVVALGPSLPVPGSLADPTLELKNQSGTTIASNDNWVDSPDKQAIMDTGVAPPNSLESALIANLPANGAQYTAIVSGVGGKTGIAVVEVFALN